MGRYSEDTGTEVNQIRLLSILVSIPLLYRYQSEQRVLHGIKTPISLSTPLRYCTFSSLLPLIWFSIETVA